MLSVDCIYEVTELQHKVVGVRVEVLARQQILTPCWA